MFGYSDFKTHVLRRDEKGMFGIPFKRLLFSALGGGAIMTVIKMFSAELSIPLGIISVFAFIFLSHPRGGLPRWKLILYAWRWRLMSAVATDPSSFLGSVGLGLKLPGEVKVDGSQIFNAADEEAPRTQLTDWISYAHLDQTDDESTAL